MIGLTSVPTAWCSIGSAPIESAGGRSRGSLLTGRAAVRFPFLVLDLVDALTARGRARLGGAARVLAPAMTAGWAVPVGADPGPPPGEDAHPATVVSPLQTSSRRLDLCHTVVLRVAWTLADLAGRIVPGPDEVAEALGLRLQRAAA